MKQSKNRISRAAKEKWSIKCKQALITLTADSSSENVAATVTIDDKLLEELKEKKCQQYQI